ncbi:MAG: efflux RND transporter periplasmic adaptor subunit, partial [Myxococcales bacterium]
MKKLLIVVLLAAGGAWYAWNARPPPAPVAASPTLARVGARTIEVAAEAAGLVEPIRVVEVKSKASGEVLRVLVDTGDEVKAGALQAEIEPRDVQNALDQALADISAARVRSQTTAAQLERMRTLRESGVVTQQEYEAAVEAAASANASVVRGETNLQLARERRRDVI